MVVVAAYALIVAHPGPVFVQGAADGPAAQEKYINEDKIRSAVSSDQSE